MFPFVNTLSLMTGFAVLILMPVTGFTADKVKQLEQVEEYLVQEKDPAVYQGSKKIGVAVLGAVVEVTHHRGPWRYSVQLNGWIHQKNLILMDKAVEELTKEILNDPNPSLYHLRGIAYMANEDWARAVNDLEEAYELGNSSTTLHINLGTCFLNLGLSEKAKSEFTTVIESFPDQAIAFQSRGDLYIDLEQYEAALVDLRRAQELAPKSAETHNSIGVALRMLGEYEAAIKAYDQAIESVPDFMSAYVNRGYAYKNLKEFKKALADYEKALELEPDSPSVKNDLAWLLSTCEDKTILDGERAVELSLEACRATEYRMADYVDTLAAAYARVGKFEKAVETAQSASELFEEEAAIEKCKKRLKLYKEENAYTDQISQDEVESQTE